MLFTYSFATPLIIQCLTDSDVLAKLVPCGKVVKQSLKYYLLKKTIRQYQASDIVSPDRYMPVLIVQMNDVYGLDSLIDHTALKKIEFGTRYNHVIPAGVIPNTVTHIKFGQMFNHPIRSGCLPESVTQLIFGVAFNRPLPAGSLPDSVTYLTLGNNFNQSIAIPESVTHLQFGTAFNQPIAPGSLPSTLESLSFGWAFNQPLDVGSIPCSVTSLVFGDGFNQPLPIGVIPDSVRYLTLASGYNLKNLCFNPASGSVLDNQVIDHNGNRTIVRSIT